MAAMTISICLVICSYCTSLLACSLSRRLSKSTFRTCAIWLTLFPIWLSSVVALLSLSPSSLMVANLLLSLMGLYDMTALRTIKLMFCLGIREAFALKAATSSDVSRMYRRLSFFFLLSIISSSCEMKDLQISKFGKIVFFTFVRTKTHLATHFRHEYNHKYIIKFGNL